MSKTLVKATVLRRIVLLALTLLFQSSTLAQAEYTTEQLYVIPWGEGPGCLSTAFNTNEYGWVFPPSPWAVSSSGVVVIAESRYPSAPPRLISLAPDGTPLGSLTLIQNGLPFPAALSISDSGVICFGYGERLFLCDSSLSIAGAGVVPLHDTWISRIYPSDHDSFWVRLESVITVDDQMFTQKHLVEYFHDGSLSEPYLMYDGFTGTGTTAAKFVTPAGDFRTSIEDMHGNTYRLMAGDPGDYLKKYTPEGDEIYNHCLESDPGWTAFDFTPNGYHYFVTWSGDFYTLHASDEGAVLTKYTLVME